jgi:hypothetical protein
MITTNDSEHSVICLAREHAKTWRNQDDSYWFARLVEEVGELGGSLVGNHEGPVEWELTQIAAICVNWSDKRASK